MRTTKEKFVKVRTKNHTARPLRRSILYPGNAVVRLGSLTPTEYIFKNPREVVTEINTVEAINNSRNKLLMKTCFSKYQVPQAEWWTFDDYVNDHIGTEDIPFPIVIKRVLGFQGRGMQLIQDQEEFGSWLKEHPNLNGWYFEKFYNYAREYRLHVAREVGVFLSWRKLRTKEAERRWFFNSENSNWVGQQHELFDQPKSWNKMKEAAINALISTGLDIGAVDIRVQSNKGNKNPKFIVCEINSAPALGKLGIEYYKNVIGILLEK